MYDVLCEVEARILYRPAVSCKEVERVYKMPVTIQPTTLKYKSGNTYTSADCIKGEKGDKGEAGNGDMLAPDYSNLTYPVKAGQHCTYNGGYYAAKQDISTSEAWTASHWIKQTVGEENASLKSALTKTTGNTFYQYNKNVRRLKSNILKEVAYTGYACTLATCVEGDVFYVTGKGGKNSKLYTFANAQGEELLSAWDNQKTTTPYRIVAPANAAYLACNSEMLDPEYPVWELYKGDGLLVDNVNNEIAERKSDTEDIKKSFASFCKDGSSPIWVYGSILSENGAETGSGDTATRDPVNRIKTANFMRGVGFIQIPAGYEYTVLYYNSNFEYQYATGFIKDTPIIIPKVIDGYYKVVVKNSDEETGLYLSDVYSNVTLYAEQIVTPKIGIASATGVISLNNNTARAAIGYFDTGKVKGIYIPTDNNTFKFFYYNASFAFAYATEWKNCNFVEFDNNYKYCAILFEVNASTKPVERIREEICVIKKEMQLREIKDEPSGTNVYYGQKLNANRFDKAKTNIGAITNGQDGAIYNSLLFRFTSGGTVTVSDINTGIQEYTYTIQTGDIPHANCVFFGEKYDSSDPFPVIYANRYNASPSEPGVLYAYRISVSESTMTLTQIQKIKINFTSDSIWTTGSDVRTYGNFLYDGENLWAFTTLDGDVNKTRFFEFDMPSFGSETVMLEKTDIVRWFDTNKMSYPQGCCCFNGIALCSYGLSNETNPNCAVNAVNLVSGETISYFNFANDSDLSGEPEFVDFYDGYMWYESAWKVVYKMIL